MYPARRRYLLHSACMLFGGLMMFKRLNPALALLLAVCAFTLSAQPAPKPAPQRTLVRAGHLLDVKTGKLAEGQTLIVVGDTIQSIAPSAQVAAQPGDAVID